MISSKSSLSSSSSSLVYFVCMYYSPTFHEYVPDWQVRYTQGAVPINSYYN